MTLLELVRQMAFEVGIAAPIQVTTSQDPQIQQIYAILSRFGRDLSRDYVWNELDKEYLLSTVNGQANYNLPTDWLRQIENTEWDRTNRWPLNGPKSPQEWQNFKSGIVYAGPRLRFRIAGGQIQLNPTPTSVATLSMEYVSSYWVRDSVGTPKATFTADTDTTVFDESLMVEGLKLRWNKAKGFAYDDKAYNDLLMKCQGQNKSAPTLLLSQGGGSILLSTANIPDGSWGA
jgi:hypothetical protein